MLGEQDDQRPAELQVLQQNVQTIHTQEATLEDISGRALGGDDLW